MIFSEKWIREWVDPALDTQQLIEQLTMAGLEVDASGPVANAFTGIVVGEVKTVEKHPDADKLSICQVSDGKADFQVVCGAPNVRAGLKVPFATIGAEILTPDSDKVFRIKNAKLRGVESNGMLCSTEELGIADSADGLMELPADAPVGEDIRNYLNLNDTSIELDLTPNRGDCLGIEGLAREIAGLNKMAAKHPQVGVVAATINDTFDIAITARDQCPRYLGRVIRNINPDAETPLWMREKLRRCGLRSIDPVVDVTNFVLIELGQPMHAFDLAKLKGSIDVRLAQEGEKITLLDGKEIALNGNTLVIADDQRAVAMAGIMGGLDTAVTTGTRDVFLECAFFSPLAIAGRARAYGMHTDASHRYERGVDFNLQQKATERATRLLLDIVGGEAGPIIEALGNLPEAKQVTLEYASVARFLGVEIEQSQIREILTGLGFGLTDCSDKGITVSVPSFRFDVEIEADLIEELARVYGYNNVPLGRGFSKQSLKSQPEAVTPLARLKQHLVSLGYQEAITYSFIDPTLSEKVCGSSSEAIVLQNPISSDMSTMRSSILPGLLSTLQYNENRQQERVRLFEAGQVFRAEQDSIKQPAMIAGLISGRKLPDNWSNNKEIYDFFDVKGDIESLLDFSRGGNDFCFQPGSHPSFHSGQCAEVVRSGRLVGYVGALHPGLQRDLGLDSTVFMFELELEAIYPRTMPCATVLSRFPEVSRDLAILINNETPAADILAVVYENAGEYLSSLRIFDVYQGDAIEKGKKSIALGLTWQHPSRTLNDDEINSIIINCIKALEEQFNASLRN
ncbi:MAG: phenylalanine--tRNA ligase subunit beta [Gammaproteobacteria bacterium]|nr:phenylalanine--tRNA ligase subunit beta [Gammaproteobacteria bacterium]